MSYASFSKSFPNLIKSIPEKLTQPTGIAVMASVGIHVLVGLSLPYLPGVSREKEPSQRTVQLTQLTPQEQSRLPQLSPPPSALSTQIQPLGSLPPSLSSSFPPLPKDLSLYKYPSLGSLPSTTRRTTRKPTNNQYSFSSLPSFNRSPNRVRFPVRNSPLWTSRSTPQPTTLSTTPIRLRPLPGGLNPAPIPDMANLPNGLPTPPNTPTPPAPSQTALQQPTTPQPDSQQPSVPTSQTPVVVRTNDAPPTPSNAPATPTPSATPTPTIIAQRVQEIRQVQESLRADSRNTTNAEARTNDVASRAKVQQAEPEILRLTGTYPKAACLKQLEGTSVHNVLVDASGKPTETDLIRSAGYPIFNQQASQQIGSRSFRNTTGTPRLFQVYTSFEYSKEICPSLRPAGNSNEQQDSPEPQNSPKPENSNERQNSPEPQNSPKPENSAEE